MLKRKRKTNDELKFNEFWAVQNVNFKVKKGEVLGIIGPNGAGKSTILKLLSKIMRPTQGEMKVHGRLSALIEVTAGFHPDFTGRENIYFNGAVLGMSKKEVDSKFDNIVDFSGIEEFIDTPVKRYSSGMTARLGFAIAAHVDPDVLLVDEVLSVGDMTFQAKCTQKMRELLQSGVTILFISHNIPLVENLCERVILLDRGIILKEGKPDVVIPFYEDLVNTKREQELKKKIVKSGGILELKDEALVKIQDVKLLDQNHRRKESFKSTDALIICIEYDSKGKIDQPIFYYEIMRLDGVVCCDSNTKGENFYIDSIEGQGTINVELEKTNLTPGVYYLRISVWDKDFVHPYGIIKKGVFKIESSRRRHFGKSVFFSDNRWYQGPIETKEA